MTDDNQSPDSTSTADQEVAQLSGYKVDTDSELSLKASVSDLCHWDTRNTASMLAAGSCRSRGSSPLFSPKVVLKVKDIHGGLQHTAISRAHGTSKPALDVTYKNISQFLGPSTSSQDQQDIAADSTSGDLEEIVTKCPTGAMCDEDLVIHAPPPWECLMELDLASDWSISISKRQPGQESVHNKVNESGRASAAMKKCSSIHVSVSEEGKIDPTEHSCSSAHTAGEMHDTEPDGNKSPTTAFFHQLATDPDLAILEKGITSSNQADFDYLGASGPARGYISQESSPKSPILNTKDPLGFNETRIFEYDSSLGTPEVPEIDSSIEYPSPPKLWKSSSDCIECSADDNDDEQNRDEPPVLQPAIPLYSVPVSPNVDLRNEVPVLGQTQVPFYTPPPEPYFMQAQSYDSSISCSTVSYDSNNALCQSYDSAANLARVQGIQNPLPNPYTLEALRGSSLYDQPIIPPMTWTAIPSNSVPNRNYKQPTAFKKSRSSENQCNAKWEATLPSDPDDKNFPIFIGTKVVGRKCPTRVVYVKPEATGKLLGEPQIYLNSPLTVQHQGEQSSVGTEINGSLASFKQTTNAAYNGKDYSGHVTGGNHQTMQQQDHYMQTWPTQIQASQQGHTKESTGWNRSQHQCVPGLFGQQNESTQDGYSRTSLTLINASKLSGSYPSESATQSGSHVFRPIENPLRSVQLLQTQKPGEHCESPVPSSQPSSVMYSRWTTTQVPPRTTTRMSAIAQLVRLSSSVQLGKVSPTSQLFKMSSATHLGKVSSGAQIFKMATVNKSVSGAKLMKMPSGQPQSLEVSSELAATRSSESLPEVSPLSKHPKTSTMSVIYQKENIFSTAKYSKASSPVVLDKMPAKQTKELLPVVLDKTTVKLTNASSPVVLDKMSAKLSKASLPVVLDKASAKLSKPLSPVVLDKALAKLSKASSPVVLGKVPTKLSKGSSPVVLDKVSAKLPKASSPVVLGKVPIKLSKPATAAQLAIQASQAQLAKIPATLQLAKIIPVKVQTNLEPGSHKKPPFESTKNGVSQRKGCAASGHSTIHVNNVPLLSQLLQPDEESCLPATPSKSATLTGKMKVQCSEPSVASPSTAAKDGVQPEIIPLHSPELTCAPKGRCSESAAKPSVVAVVKAKGEQSSPELCTAPVSEVKNEKASEPLPPVCNIASSQSAPQPSPGAATVDKCGQPEAGSGKIRQLATDFCLLPIKKETEMNTGPPKAKRTKKEARVKCGCTRGCRINRCRCAQGKLPCGFACRCKNCENPLNLLLKIGINTKEAANDSCLMGNIFRLVDTEGLLNKQVIFPCCHLYATLGWCIPGEVCCPNGKSCGKIYKYSWCRGELMAKETGAGRHCDQCNRCVADQHQHCVECKTFCPVDANGKKCSHCVQKELRRSRKQPARSRKSALQALPARQSMADPYFGCSTKEAEATTTVLQEALPTTQALPLDMDLGSWDPWRPLSPFSLY